MSQKTNAARLLDQMGIRYELREYEVDPADLAAEAVAAKIGVPPGQVFKTLVAQGDRLHDSHSRGHRIGPQGTRCCLRQP